MATSTASAYGLAAPSEADALASLQRMLGADQGQIVWQQACAAGGFRRPGPPLSLDQLLAVANYLKGQSGLTCVVGNSLSVRLRAFKSLNK